MRTIITVIGEAVVLGTCVAVWIIAHRQKVAAGAVRKAEMTPRIALTFILIAIAISISLAIQFEKLK